MRWEGENHRAVRGVEELRPRGMHAVGAFLLRDGVVQVAQIVLA